MITLSAEAVATIIAALAVLCSVAIVGLVVVAILLCEQVGSRRSAERRANRLAGRVRKLLQLDEPVPAPALPATETQRLPRIPHAPTYRPAAVTPPSTALVPRDAQLPVPVPPRDVVRAR